MEKVKEFHVLEYALDKKKKQIRKEHLLNNRRLQRKDKGSSTRRTQRKRIHVQSLEVPKKGKEKAIDSDPDDSPIILNEGPSRNRDDGVAEEISSKTNAESDLKRKRLLVDERLESADKFLPESKKRKLIEHEREITQSFIEWPIEDLEMRYIECRAVLELLREWTRLSSRYLSLQLSEPCDTIPEPTFRGFKSRIETTDIPHEPFTEFHIEMLELVYRNRQDPRSKVCISIQLEANFEPIQNAHFFHILV